MLYRKRLKVLLSAGLITSIIVTAAPATNDMLYLEQPAPKAVASFAFFEVLDAVVTVIEKEVDKSGGDGKDMFKAVLGVKKKMINKAKQEQNKQNKKSAPVAYESESYESNEDSYADDDHYYEDDDHYYEGDEDSYEGDEDSYEGDEDSYEGDEDSYEGDEDSYADDDHYYEGDEDSSEGNQDYYEGDEDYGHDNEEEASVHPFYARVNCLGLSEESVKNIIDTAYQNNLLNVPRDEHYDDKYRQISMNLGGYLNGDISYEDLYNSLPQTISSAMQLPTSDPYPNNCVQ